MFDEVLKNLKSINHLEKKDFLDSDNIELLESFSTSLKLRDNLIKLVESYHDLIFKVSSKDIESKFSLLVIDDLDLNTKHSSQLLDQIHKYLIIPNVIILLAVDFYLLLDTESINQYSQFSGLENLKEQVLSNEIKEYYNVSKKIASLVLKKIVPETNRLVLPSMRTDFYKKEIGYFKQNGKLEYLAPDTIDMLESILLRKLDVKIKLSLDHSYFLLPRNIRELHQMIELLISLDDPFSSNDALEKNVSIFLEVVVYGWLQDELPDEYVALYKRLLNSNTNYLNKQVIEEIKELKIIFLEKDTSLQKDNEGLKKEIKLIFNSLNNPRNISFGDVMFVLGKVKNISGICETLWKSIRLLYSLRMKVAETNHDFKSLQSIINGQFTNHNIQLMPRSNKLKLRRDYLQIDNYKEILQDVAEDNKLDYLLQNFIIYRGKQEEDYRTDDEIFYKRYVPNQYSNATFYILAFLYYQYDYEYFQKLDSKLNHKQKDMSIPPIQLHDIDKVDAALKEAKNKVEKSKGLTDAQYIKQFLSIFINNMISHGYIKEDYNFIESEEKFILNMLSKLFIEKDDKLQLLSEYMSISYKFQTNIGQDLIDFSSSFKPKPDIGEKTIATLIEYLVKLKNYQPREDTLSIVSLYQRLTATKFKDVNLETDYIYNFLNSLRRYLIDAIYDSTNSYIYRGEVVSLISDYIFTIIMFFDINVEKSS